MSVKDGVAQIGDPYGDDDEQHAAQMIASRVPGVVNVQVNQ